LIVHCLELGSDWWNGIRYDVDGCYAPAKSTFLNTTSMPRGSNSKKYRQCWNVVGSVRFNLAGFPRATMPSDLLGVNALTNGLELFNGVKRLLFRRAVSSATEVDACLVVVRSVTCGRIDFRSNWKSAGVEVVCASATKGQQETLVLMPNKASIRTEDGTWEIQWQHSKQRRKRARLVRREDRFRL
jgi:hypothetical protein